MKLTSLCSWESPLWPIKLLEMALAIICVGLLSTHCFGYTIHNDTMKTYGFLVCGSFFFISCFSFVIDLFFYEDTQIPYLEAALGVVASLMYFAFGMWIPAYSSEFITSDCNGIFLAIWVSVALNTFFYGFDAYVTIRIIGELTKKMSSVYYLQVDQQKSRPANLNIC